MGPLRFGYYIVGGLGIDHSQALAPRNLTENPVRSHQVVDQVIGVQVKRYRELERIERANQQLNRVPASA